MSDLDAHITLSAEPAVQRHAREGHSFVLLKLGGEACNRYSSFSPIRIRRQDELAHEGPLSEVRVTSNLCGL